MKSDMQTGKHGDKEGVTNRINVQNSDRKKSCQDKVDEVGGGGGRKLTLALVRAFFFCSLTKGIALTRMGF